MRDPEIDADLHLGHGRNFDGEHVPAPAGHAPPLEAFGGARGRIKIHEIGNAEAWINGEGVEVRR